MSIRSTCILLVRNSIREVIHNNIDISRVPRCTARVELAKAHPNYRDRQATKATEEERVHAAMYVDIIISSRLLLQIRHLLQIQCSNSAARRWLSRPCRHGVFHCNVCYVSYNIIMLSLH